jgi:hypothetical protein
MIKKPTVNTTMLKSKQVIKMAGTLYGEIKLSNGLVIEIWDHSRLIGKDTTKVEFLFKTRIDVNPSYFAELSHFEQTKNVFGAHVFFEYRMARSFVKKQEKEDVSQAFIKTFTGNVLVYLSKPDFPKCFVLSKYRDIIKNPYKYLVCYDETSS